MKKLVTLPNGFEQGSEHSEEKKVLSIRELLEVQGGLDTDVNLDDCTSQQCTSAAVLVCDSKVL